MYWVELYSKKKFGLLKAYELGAEIIATIDDDNIPLKEWGKKIYINQDIEIDYYLSDNICFDPIAVTNHSNLWHRGFPLQLLSKRKYRKTKKIIQPDIQADFWNGDPDIDAICRMEHMPNCDFDKKLFPFSSNTFSPFNSQNTFLSRNVIRDYFYFHTSEEWMTFGHHILFNQKVSEFCIIYPPCFKNVMNTISLKI